MDLILKLSRPDDYRQEQGARVRVEFDKARGLYGEACAPFVARLEDGLWIDEGYLVPGGLRAQQRRRIENEILAQVAKGGDQGASGRDLTGNVAGRNTTVRTTAEDLVVAGRLEKRDGRYYATV